MRRLPTATGNGLSDSQLRAKLDRQPRTRWKMVQVAAAIALVGSAAWLIDDSGLKLVGIIVGVSAATFLLMRVFD